MLDKNVYTLFCRRFLIHESHILLRANSTRLVLSTARKNRAAGTWPLSSAQGPPLGYKAYYSLQCASLCHSRGNRAERGIRNAEAISAQYLHVALEQGTKKLFGCFVKVDVNERRPRRKNALAYFFCFLQRSFHNRCGRAFYLWRSRAGLGLLRDILLLVVFVVFVFVMLVDIFELLSRRPPTKIFIKTKL